MVPCFKHYLKRAECMGSDSSGKESSCESTASAKGLGLGQWLFQGVLQVHCCCGERAKALEEPQSDGGENFEASFTLGKLIGHGSFGKVYACQSSSNENLCVKIVATSGHHGAHVAKLPKEEKLELLRLLNSLDHPNIVSYYQFFQTTQALYIVMSRCQGPDLMEHMEASGDLSMQAVKEISRMMLLAIGAVHSKGLMHRDIKPENFRFKDSAATTLQLLDFGGAKVADETPKAHSITGTLLYAAPEVFKGFYNRSCDLWSCGIVIFLLVSGHLPFQTSDVTMLRSMHQDPVLMGECLFRGVRWLQAPNAARSLVRGLLCVKPSLRLTAAAACEHHWMQCCDKDSAETSSTEDQEKDSVVSPFESGSHDLKRTPRSFAWNLAAASDASDAESAFGGGHEECSWPDCVQEPEGREQIMLHGT